MSKNKPLSPALGRHSREQLFMDRPWVVIVGKDMKSFYRVPTDMRSWSMIEAAGGPWVPEKTLDHV